MKYFVLFALCLFVPTLAFATPYAVMKDESTLTFSGEHAGNRFEGVFTDYIAEIDFNPESPETTKALITFDLREAETGNKLYDGTLPSADWFDATNHPQAVFELTDMATTENGYTATGDLTIRAITKPVTFNFTLDGTNPVTMTAEFPVNRLDYNIGAKSDPKAEWVSEDILIKILLQAMPQ